MALPDLYSWRTNAKDEKPSPACGSACGSGDKPTACGAGDKPTACGSACGSGDK